MGARPHVALSDLPGARHAGQGQPRCAADHLRRVPPRPALPGRVWYLPGSTGCAVAVLGRGQSVSCVRAGGAAGDRTRFGFLAQPVAAALRGPSARRGTDAHRPRWGGADGVHLLDQRERGPAAHGRRRLAEAWGGRGPVLPQPAGCAAAGRFRLVDGLRVGHPAGGPGPDRDGRSRRRPHSHRAGGARHGTDACQGLWIAGAADAQPDGQPAGLGRAGALAGSAPPARGRAGGERGAVRLKPRLAGAWAPLGGRQTPPPLTPAPARFDHRDHPTEPGAR